MPSFLKHTLIFLLLVCSLKQSFAQSIASLELDLINAKHDTARCYILNELIEKASDQEWRAYNNRLLTLAKKNSETTSNIQLKKFYLRQVANALNNIGYGEQVNGNNSKALDYFNKSLVIRLQINDKSGIANSYNEIGTVFSYEGNIPKALEYFERCLKLLEEIQDKLGLGYVLNNIGSIYSSEGSIEKALEYLHNSLKAFEEIHFEKGIAISLISIGSVHVTQNNSDKALEYFQRSLKIREKINDQTGIANALDEIGNVYKYQNKLDKSLMYFQKSLKIQEEINDANGIGVSLNNLGLNYYLMGDLNKALDYDQRSLKIREQIQDKEGISLSLISIAKTLLEMGEADKALVYGNKSLILAKELGYPNNIRNSAKILKKIYIKQNKYKQVFEMFELEVKMADSTNNQQTQKATLKKQMQYDYDKKELLLKAEQDKKDIIAQEELRQKEKERNYFIAGFALVLLLALFILRSYRQKQKDNKLITTQKHLLEEKQKEILDSIHYAKRIQTALMTNENYIDKSLNRLNK